ncbi:MAG: hypothetical protein QOG04_2029 [Actinomycetota bacterium]|jgi:methyl-accepting chemotaxis protein|nr:hypothetical protein [Actinomycetota bacterium]
MIAKLGKGTHVTILTMARAPLALLIALSLGACASGTPSSTEPSAETTQAISALEDRVADLEADLLAAEDGRTKLSDRIDSLGDKLAKSLDRLQESLAQVRSGSSEAADSAASALASAQAVASDLAVLEQRYEYHLRRYHGGGG